MVRQEPFLATNVSLFQLLGAHVSLALTIWLSQESLLDNRDPTRDVLPTIRCRASLQGHAFAERYTLHSWTFQSKNVWVSYAIALVTLGHVKGQPL
jgi:hypothetical protein